MPVHVQYGRWVGGIFLHGTLGESLFGGALTVEEKIIDRLPVTIELGVLAIVIGLLIALPVGIYSAIRQDTAADYVGRSIAVIGLATPNFWLGIMVMIFPAIWWGWAPPLQYISFTEDPLGNLGILIIPSLILGTAMAAATSSAFCSRCWRFSPTFTPPSARTSGWWPPRCWCWPCRWPTWSR